MLVRRLTPREVAAHMRCSVATARDRMRQMTHTENPLTVTEEAIERWYAERTVESTKREKSTARSYHRHIAPTPGEVFLIPRKRPKN